MGVEKKIRRMVENPPRSKRRSDDADAKEFAQQVLTLLRESQDKLVEGETKNEAERLAAILAFIRGLVTSVVHQSINYPITHRIDGPRQRVALEAGQMIYDIVHQQRHPVHRFFRGLLTDAMAPRQAPRKELHRRALLMACTRALEVANVGQMWSRAKAIRTMRKNSVLADHIQSEQWLTNLISQQADSTDPDYKGLIADLLNRLRAAQATTTDTIIMWTAANLQFSEAPLDMAAATQIETLVSMLVPPDGGTPILQLPGGKAVPLVALPAGELVAADPSQQLPPTLSFGGAEEALRVPTPDTSNSTAS